MADQKERLIIEFGVSDSGAIVFTDALTGRLDRLKAAAAGTSQAMAGVQSAGKRTRQSVAETEQGVNTLTNAGVRARRAFYELGAQFFVFNQVMASLDPLFGRIDQLMNNSINSGARFEQQMADVGSIIRQSRDQMSSFTDEMIALISAAPVSPEDLGSAAYQTVSANITQQAQVMKVLYSSTMLSVAGIGSLTQAVNVVTSVINAYGLTAYDANEISNVLFSTVVYGKTTVSQLAESFGQILPLARDLGVTFEELNATIAVMTNAGLSTGEAMTNLRQGFMAFMQPSETMLDLLTDMGVKNGALALATDGVALTFHKLIQASKGSRAELTSALGRIQAMQAVLIAGGPEYEKVIEFTKKFTEETNYLATAYQRATDTLARQQILKSNAQWVAATRVFQDVRDTLSDVTQGVTKMTNMWNGFMDAFPVFREFVSYAVLAVGVLASLAKTALNVAFQYATLQMVTGTLIATTKQQVLVGQLATAVTVEQTAATEADAVAKAINANMTTRNAGAQIALGGAYKFATVAMAAFSFVLYRVLIPLGLLVAAITLAEWALKKIFGFDFIQWATGWDMSVSVMQNLAGATEETAKAMQELADVADTPESIADALLKFPELRMDDFKAMDWFTEDPGIADQIYDEITRKVDELKEVQANLLMDVARQQASVDAAQALYDRPTNANPISLARARAAGGWGSNAQSPAERKAALDQLTEEQGKLTAREAILQQITYWVNNAQAAYTRQREIMDKLLKQEQSRVEPIEQVERRYKRISELVEGTLKGLKEMSQAQQIVNDRMSFETDRAKDRKASLEDILQLNRGLVGSLAEQDKLRREELVINKQVAEQGKNLHMEKVFGTGPFSSEYMQSLSDQLMHTTSEQWLLNHAEEFGWELSKRSFRQKVKSLDMLRETVIAARALNIEEQYLVSGAEKERAARSRLVAETIKGNAAAAAAKWDSRISSAQKELEIKQQLVELVNWEATKSDEMNASLERRLGQQSRLVEYARQRDELEQRITDLQIKQQNAQINTTIRQKGVFAPGSDAFRGIVRGEGDDRQAWLDSIDNIGLKEFNKRFEEQLSGAWKAMQPDEQEQVLTALQQQVAQSRVLNALQDTRISNVERESLAELKLVESMSGVIDIGDTINQTLDTFFEGVVQGTADIKDVLTSLGDGVKGEFTKAFAKALTEKFKFDRIFINNIDGLTTKTRKFGEIMAKNIGDGAAESAASVAEMGDETTSVFAEMKTAVFDVFASMGNFFKDMGTSVKGWFSGAAPQEAWQTNQSMIPLANPARYASASAGSTTLSMDMTSYIEGGVKAAKGLETSAELLEKAAKKQGTAAAATEGAAVKLDGVGELLDDTALLDASSTESLAGSAASMAKSASVLSTAAGYIGTIAAGAFAFKTMIDVTGSAVGQVAGLFLSDSKAEGAAEGAKQGAMYGAIAMGIGAVIGAVIGAIVGAINSDSVADTFAKGVRASLTKLLKGWDKAIRPIDIMRRTGEESAGGRYVVSRDAPRAGDLIREGRQLQLAAQVLALLSGTKGPKGDKSTWGYSEVAGKIEDIFKTYAGRRDQTEAALLAAWGGGDMAAAIDRAQMRIVRIAREKMGERPKFMPREEEATTDKFGRTYRRREKLPGTEVGAYGRLVEIGFLPSIEKAIVWIAEAFATSIAWAVSKSIPDIVRQTQENTAERARQEAGDRLYKKRRAKGEDITREEAQIEADAAIEKRGEIVTVEGAEIVRRIQLSIEAFGMLANGITAAAQMFMELSNSEKALKQFRETVKAAAQENMLKKFQDAFMRGVDMENLLSPMITNFDIGLQSIWDDFKDWKDSEDPNKGTFDFMGRMNTLIEQVNIDFAAVEDQMNLMGPLIEQYAEMQKRLIAALTTFTMARDQLKNFSDTIDMLIAGFAANSELEQGKVDARLKKERYDDIWETLIQDSFHGLSVWADAFFAAAGSGKNPTLVSSTLQNMTDEELKYFVTNLGAASQALADAAQAEIDVLNEQLKIAEAWRDVVEASKDSLAEVQDWGGDPLDHATKVFERERDKANELIKLFYSGTEEQQLAAAEELSRLGPELLDLAQRAGFDPGSYEFEGVRSTFEKVLNDIIAKGMDLGSEERVLAIQKEIRDIQAKALQELKDMKAAADAADAELAARAAAADKASGEFTGPTGPPSRTASATENTFAILNRGINVVAHDNQATLTEKKGAFGDFNPTSLASGGLVTANEQLILAHGPEVIVPLDRLGATMQALGYMRKDAYTSDLIDYLSKDYQVGRPDAAGLDYQTTQQTTSTTVAPQVNINQQISASLTQQSKDDTERQFQEMLLKMLPDLMRKPVVRRQVRQLARNLQ